MSLRQDEGIDDWPLRPWILAGICSVVGLIFHWITEPNQLPAWRQALASFVAIATLAFVFTVELRRLSWSLIFGAGWGAIVALVGWSTAKYNVEPTVFEWPYLSGIFAVLIAAPLFQTVRDVGAWRFPYDRLHRHAWTDAVIGAASLSFTGIVFLLAWLISGLFDLIGIDAIERLLREDWFGWMLAGAAFGAAVGLLRERDGLLTALQRLVMVVFSVLAPVLAVALILFLASLPFTGLATLWDSEVPTTPLLLIAGAGAILLANAVTGNGEEDRSNSRILWWSAIALVAVILPLAILASVSMGIRINQYGWTPERIWGVVAVGIAIAYGIAGWWSIYRRREIFDEALRPLQIGLAIGLCGVALFLALPILDFGAISAKSQLARLEGGKVTAEEFDWAAMAFDFGPRGRERLMAMSKDGPANRRQLASVALKAENRWSLSREAAIAENEVDIERRVRLLSPDIQWNGDLRRRISARSDCSDGSDCALIRIGPDHLLLLRTYGQDRHLSASIIDLRQPAPREDTLFEVDAIEQVALIGDEMPKGVDLGAASVEVRNVTVQQVHVDGRPVGPAVPISR